MANLVNLEAVSKSYGVRPLLAGVSLGIDAGDRIGVVGLNGGGKTTLLEVLAGLQPPDAGRVSHARGLRAAVLTQRTELPAGATVGHAVLSGLGVSAEHEWAADPRVRGVLDGLGIQALGLDRPVAGLSGGERRRVALAAALVGELDLVMLDEPTNHLDVEGVQWLAEHLVARRCAVVVVTHDRWFLDTVCTRTWEVTDGRVDGYDGGYADWVYARAERLRLAAAADDRRRNLASPGPTRAQLQAALPHRGRRGADQRRAPTAGYRRAARLRPTPAGPYRAGARGRHGGDRRPPAARRRDVADRAR
jgi:ABC transport system ATP-binding/permease protein